MAAIDADSEAARKGDPLSLFSLPKTRSPREENYEKSWTKGGYIIIPNSVSLEV